MPQASRQIGSKPIGVPTDLSKHSVFGMVHRPEAMAPHQVAGAMRIVSSADVGLALGLDCVEVPQVRAEAPVFTAGFRCSMRA